MSVRCCLSKAKEIRHKYSPLARSSVDCNFQSTMVDDLRGSWWSRSSSSSPDYWHRHMLLLLQKVYWLFCLSFLFFKLYINLTLSILYHISFFCTLSRSALAKDQGVKYDSWNTEDFDNSTNGIFRKVLAIFDVNRFGHIM